MPKPNQELTEVIRFRVNPETARAIEREARKDERDPSSWLRLVVKRELLRVKQPKPKNPAASGKE